MQAYTHRTRVFVLNKKNQFLARLLRCLGRVKAAAMGPDDPVKHCEVYKSSQGCAHVDGFLCYYPDCALRDEIDKNKARHTQK